MATNVNSAVVSGRLTRDPELRHTPSGATVCSFAIASNRSRKSGDEWVEEVDYFDVETWGRRAEFLGEKLQKGDRVLVQGSLRQNRWEAQDGTKRSKVFLSAVNVEFDSAVWRNGDGDGGSRSSRREESSSSDFVPAAPVDDDIPF